MKRRGALGVAALAVMLAEPRPAAAQDAVLVGPKETPPWEVAGVASYQSAPIRGGTNPFGAGFGGRFGRSFGRLYIGANVVDYLGGTDVDLQARALLWGGEVGFSFRRSLGGGLSLLVRPGLGVGAAMLFYTLPTTTVTTSNVAPTSHVVDMISTASHRTTPVSTVPSTSTGSGSTTTGSSASGSTNTTTGSPSSGAATTSTPATTIVTTSNDTTTETSLYLQPSLSVMLESSFWFAGAKGSALILPTVGDGLGGSALWVTYGIEGDVGVRF